MTNGTQVSKKLLISLVIFIVVFGIVGVSMLNFGSDTTAGKLSTGGSCHTIQTGLSGTTGKPSTTTQLGNPQAPQQETAQIPNRPNTSTIQSTPIPQAPAGSLQDIYIHARADGTYDKSSITVKSGVPVRLHFTADPNAGCGRQIVIYGLKNVQAFSRSGEEQIVEFTPTTPGTYTYNCGMMMWKSGKLVVQ